MPSYYYDKLTGQLTTKQYSQDPRTGTLIANSSAPMAAVAQAGLVPSGSTAVTGAGGQSYNVQNYQLAALRGEYGPDAQREAMGNVSVNTGRSIGGNNQPTPIGDNRPMGLYDGAMTVSDPRGNVKSITRQQSIGDLMVGRSPERVPAKSLQQIAAEQARYRPGYTPDVENLDPLATERLRQQYERESRTRLEGQAQNQLQQWAQNKVEFGSSYHYLGKRSGIAVPANPFEYQADLAVEFLKGRPQKSSEWFSPVSGEMSNYLPGGFYGIQEMYWDKALARDRGQGEYIAGMPTGNLVQTRTQIDPLTSITGWSTSSEQASFIPAIQHIQMAEGRYGPYGQLFGGDGYVGTPSSDGLRKQPDFVFTPEARSNVEAATRLSAIERGDGFLATVFKAPTNTPMLPPQAPRQEEMVKGPDGLMYPDYMVPWGNTSSKTERLRGGNMVAGSAVIVAEGAHADELNAIKKCNQSFSDAISGKSGNVFGGGPLPVSVARPSTSMADPTKSGEQLFTPFWFNETSNAISKLPILGDIYRAGAGVDKRTVNAVKVAVSTPFFESISKGGEVFAAMKEYERSPSDATGLRYKAKVSGFVGADKNEQMQTAGISDPLLSLGKGYREGITKPVENFIGKGIVQSAVMGLVDVPGSVPDMIGMSIVGGERTVKNIGNFPGLAAAGGAMAVDSFVKDPVRFTAGLVGTYGLFRAAGAVTQKGIGVVRSRGMEYVPLENIGYGPEGRYPLNPVQSGRQLSMSFREGVLYPEPTAMAEGGPVPYLHGKAGHPTARLPNAQAGDTTLWTALETSSRTRGVPVGDAYVLETSGGSEVRGMYGAPILESYFLKVGNKPQMVGFDLPFKTPTAYSTVVPSVEAIPKAIRRTTASGDWTAVNEYVQRRSQTVPAGQAYMPLVKAEYEAIAPDFTVMEITGRNYYTKVGGLGQSHFLGTRVPVVEQRAIGFDVLGSQQAVKSTAPRNVIPDYYRPPARLGGNRVKINKPVTETGIYQNLELRRTLLKDWVEHNIEMAKPLSPKVGKLNSGDLAERVMNNPESFEPFHKSGKFPTFNEILEGRQISKPLGGIVKPQQAVKTTGPRNVIPDYYRPPARIGGYSLIGASGISMGSGLSAQSGTASTRSQILGSGSPVRSGGSSSTRPSSKPFSGSSAGKRLSSSIVGSSSALTSRSTAPVESYLRSSLKSITSPLSKTTSKIGSSTTPYSGGYSGASGSFTPYSPTTTKRTTTTSPPTTPFTPGPPFVFAGLFGGGSGGSNLSKGKRPFREIIPLESQLFNDGPLDDEKWFTIKKGSRQIIGTRVPKGNANVFIPQVKRAPVRRKASRKGRR